MLNLTKPTELRDAGPRRPPSACACSSAGRKSVGVESENVFQGPQRPAARSRPRGRPFRRSSIAGVMYVGGVNIGDPPTPPCATVARSPPTGSSSSSSPISSDDGSVVADPR